MTTVRAARIKGQGSQYVSPTVFIGNSGTEILGTSWCKARISCGEQHTLEVLSLGGEQDEKNEVILTLGNHRGTAAIRKSWKMPESARIPYA